MKPSEAREAAELQKALVKRHLRDASHLWDKLEYPTSGDEVDIATSYSPEAQRYARQGRKFIQYAMEYGTIKAKCRVRDEWKAKCYNEGMDHRHVRENTGYEDALAAYRRRMQMKTDTYYRNG